MSQTTTGHQLPSFEEAEGLGPQDKEFARDVREVLRKHGNLDRFGLCLLHEHFEMSADEVMVETNDPTSRTLTIRPEKAATTSHAKPSQWRFVDAPHTRTAEFDGSPYQVVLFCNPWICDPDEGAHDLPN